MKTLIVSNNEKVLNFFTQISLRGYDVIVYRWLMKAMDNLEEIKPQIIIIDTDEYPRHWKTMASFLQSGLGGNEINLYLYSSTPFSKDELEKSTLLGVKKIFSSFDNDELEDEFKTLARGALSFPSAEDKTDCIILTDPNDNSFSYGSVDEQDGNVYVCSVKDSARFSSGEILKYVSFFHDGTYTNCSAKVVCIDSDRKCLSLEIKELYEAC